MQVLISSARPLAALATNCGSARNGRAIDTMSASPRAMIASASAGMLMRFDATTGIVTSRRKRPATLANAARGTEVTMVGTRASCQPKPVLRIVTPACSSAFATVTTSSQVLPPSTRSSSEWRYMMMKSGPTLARMRWTISTGRRMRFSMLPPQRSVRWLVRAHRNWLSR